ncbi:MAG: hypothetical protein Q7U57_08570 [Methylovulum sp.]|nr:hypothetical protein [Methylovulum sp.]
MAKKILVIGPSHVKRLEHALLCGILPAPEVTVDFLGRDGMPVWHPVFSRHLQSVDYDHILVIVGDFRFGNKIFANTEAKNAGGVGVAKALINLDNDDKLYQKSLAKIDEWIAVFGNKIRFLFWDLLGREFANRRDNKYTVAGQYSHPSWNYDAIAERYRSHIVDVGFLKDIFMDRLTVDSANHFSMFAYLMMVDALRRTGHETAVKKEELAFKIKVLDEKFNRLPLSGIYLVCDPPILNRLTQALDKGALPRHNGLTLISTQAFIARKLPSTLDASAKVLYLSSFRRVEGEDNTAKYQRLVNTLAKFGLRQDRFNIVFYDYSCDYVFELRKQHSKQPCHLPDSADVYSLASLQKRYPNTIGYPLDNFQFIHSLFELSGRLPNFKGYFFILMSARLGQTSAEYANFYYDYFIDDVFATADKGVADIPDISSVAC